MKKPLKIAGAILVVILIIVTGLSFFVKSYLTDERVRALVTESAESALKRKVTLGSVSVSIFRGISVDNFEVKEKGSDADFLQARAFTLRYQLLPLLSRRLIIDEMGIESPQVVVRKNADGSFNFSDIMRSKSEEGPAERGAGKGGLPVSLSIKSLRIKNAQIQYSDPEGKISKAVVGINADMDIEGRSREVIGSSGKAEIVFLELVLKGRQKPVREFPISAVYQAELDYAGKRLTLGEAKVEAAGIPVVLKGTMNYGGPLSYKLEVNAESANLAGVQKTAEGLLPQGVGIDGVLSLRLTAEQKPAEDSKPVFSGEARLNNVGISLGKMKPVFSGTVTFTPKEIGFKEMKLVAGSSSANIIGRIEDYSTTPDIRIDLKSPMLDIDRIMLPLPGRGEAGTHASSGVNQVKEEKEIGPLKTKMRAEGDVDIAKMLYKGVNVVNIKAHYIFHSNVLTVSPVSGGTLSGNFNARSTLDLSKKGAAYTLHAETNGIRLEEITAAFAPKAKETLFGSLSARADISGAGSVSQTIKRNLKGKGIFSVRDGKIRNARISEGLLALLGLQNLKEIPIEKAGGTFTVSGGLINLNSVIESKDLSLDETGTIGMDQKLNMNILVKVSDRLSPALLNQSGLSQFLSEEKGWTAVPLKLGGTITNPSYAVDTRAIGKRATQTIKKKAGEEIFKALSGEQQKKSPAEQPAGAQEKKSASPENLLKQLFK